MRLEQRLAARLGQLRDEVGGVVGLHLVEHVGGARVVELADQVDLVLFRHLLEGVGEAAVGQLLRDLDAALLRQVEQGARQVGGQQVGVGGDELLGRLGLALRGLLADLGPGREHRGALAERRGSRARPAEEEVADRPFAGRHLLDRDVLDDGLAGSVAQHDLAAEQLGDHAHLAAALLEAAQVDEAGGDDLAGADARDAPDRQEHAALAGDLDDQADDRRALLRAVDDEHVAHLADLVAVGVEDGAPGQSGDEDSRGAHV